MKQKNQKYNKETTRKNTIHNQIKGQIIKRNKTHQYFDKITKTQIRKHEIKCEIKKDLSEFYIFKNKIKKTESESSSLSKNIQTYPEISASKKMIVRYEGERERETELK
jgi:AICAR transformylase/IMP cyclohydrolase PurH